MILDHGEEEEKKEEENEEEEEEDKSMKNWKKSRGVGDEKNAERNRMWGRMERKEKKCCEECQQNARPR